MTPSISRKLMYAALAVFPAILCGFSTGPPIMRTGAPADGGITCAACHQTFAPANSDARGSVTISASPYVPGVTQTLKITISHPDQKRWGFEIITRMASDASKQAGTFLTNPLVRVRCSTGHDTPCAGAQEFAEHNSAQVTAVGAGFTYTVDWTPPATNVGDIILYAAGNAANGDGTFNGDRIYTTSVIVSPAGPCNLSALPFLKSAVSAASYSNVISPGSIIALFGAGFQTAGLSRGLYPADVASGSFPQKLSCVAVEVDGKRAPLTYVSENQINAQVPSSIGATPSQVRVVMNPDAGTPVFSSPILVRSATVAPAWFTLDGTHAAAQFAGTADLVADPALFAGAKAAKAGDMVTVYATGLGDTNPHVDAGVTATKAAPCISQPTISVGGIVVAPADIQYAGLTPGMISGLYQINFKVPAGAAAGDQAVKLGVSGQNGQDGVTLRVTQ